MREHFDSRVLSVQVLDFIRACQARVECHLGGGTALSGAWLSHRRSRDIDLFCHDSVEHRSLVAELTHVAHEVGATCRVVRDGRHHVRATLNFSDEATELDLVFDPLRDLEPPPAIDGVTVQSLLDLRASKLTCLLSRAEPRDLVDVLFLERSGYPPEHDLPLAIQKDTGMDPGILAWLLRDFPVQPLPEMLVPLSTEELSSYRDELAERLRKLSLP
jgi:nucleotidyltransferase AbiEii toxin of type IV toxin-antitoxin system